MVLSVQDAAFKTGAVSYTAAWHADLDVQIGGMGLPMQYEIFDNLWIVAQFQPWLSLAIGNAIQLVSTRC